MFYFHARCFSRYGSACFIFTRAVFRAMEAHVLFSRALFFALRRKRLNARKRLMVCIIEALLHALNEFFSAQPTPEKTENATESAIILDL